VIWTIGMVLVAIAALVPGEGVRAVSALQSCAFFVCGSDSDCHEQFGDGCQFCSTQVAVLPGRCSSYVAS
ncbi:MAG: hypothetical protein RQ745_14000, partial [Longimicrobiales bacterium]|nr:hypothetical protein [Longimicrobiales bacterium]